VCLRSCLTLTGCLLALTLPSPAAGSVAGIVGTIGDDRLVGTQRDDEIAGLGGDDLTIARGGDDWAYDAGGDDVFHMGPGNDRVNPGGGRNTVHGEEGDDNLYGEGRGDRLYGGPGNDRFLLSPKVSARVTGGAGDDLVSTRFGQLRAAMGGGNDLVKLRSDAAVDYVSCGPGSQDHVHYKGKRNFKRRDRSQLRADYCRG
jgi:Ca2+-binding RTX toxin-like protein